MMEENQSEYIISSKIHNKNIDWVCELTVIVGYLRSICPKVGYI